MSVAELPSSAVEFERMPPQDIAAEQCVLGGMLLSKDAIADVVEVLRSHDFYRPAHQTIFDAVLDLYGRGEPADAVTIGAALAKAGEIGRVGGAPYLHTLIASVPTAANAGYYAQIVHERALLRRLVEAGTRITQMGYSADGSDADDVVDRASAELYAVSDRRTSEDYLPLAEIMEGALDEIEAIGSRGGAMAGVPTGFADLDQLTNGLHSGQMIIVAARPAIGKALALGTSLPTPTGWTTMGEVAVGDLLLGSDGRPTRVVAATPVLTGRPCYAVTFSDGEVLVADAEHQWVTHAAADAPSGAAPGHTAVLTGGRVVTTHEIASSVRVMTRAGVRVNHRVETTAPLPGDHVPLPVAPAALAAALRSGDRAVLEVAGAWGPDGPCVPLAYRRAAPRQRRDLLDAVVALGTEVSTPARDLVLDLHELVVGLGLRCPLPNREVGGGWWTLRLPSLPSLPPGGPADSLAQSSAWSLPGQRRPLGDSAGQAPDDRPTRYITACEPVASVSVRCVEVAADDHLYLAGRSMIPTHNSTLGLDFARSAAIKNGLATVIFSLEMSRNEITMRLLSAEARVALHHMRAGTMTDDDWGRLARRMGEVSDAPLFIDDSPNMSMMEIRAKCRRLKQQHDLKLVVLDYMQLMTSGKRVESRQQEVSEFSRSLKLLAKELEVPVIAISQLNRGPEQRTDKKPMLSDLRESGSLEQDADMVILLHREDAYEKESPRAGEADLIVAKHRNGPTSTITVAFQGHYSRFVDMAQ